jgi:TM2 domain-containing membrane protein YozV
MKLKLIIALTALQFAFVANTNAAWITPAKAKTEQASANTAVTTAPSVTTQEIATTEKTEVTESATKIVKKEKWVAYVLAALFGTLGVHNFYMGNTKKGLMQLGLTVIGIGCIIGAVLSIAATIDNTDALPIAALALYLTGALFLFTSSIWAWIDAIRIFMDKIDVESGTAGGW